MKRYIFLAPLMVITLYAAQAPEFQKIKDEIKTMYQDIRHPERALEDAIADYIIRKVSDQIKEIAHQEAQKLLIEIKPKW